jgi:hypothetical protein
VAAKKYSNRSDLANPAQKIAASAAKGQTYGEAGKQMAAQKAVPMGASPADNVPAPVQVQPGSLGRLDRPTERPAEPVTAGASFGPGPTPSTAFAVPRDNDPVLNELRALYLAYPSDDLADLLESYVREGY